MIQVARRFEFFLEARLQGVIVGHALRHDLDGDNLFRFPVSPFIDCSHAPFGDLVEEVVAANFHEGRFGDAEGHAYGLGLVRNQGVESQGSGVGRD